MQVEALAALMAWVKGSDSGEWDDPPAKLALLYDLERVAALLRGGGEPFHPDRARLAFARFLINAGCQPPPGASRACQASGDEAPGWRTIGTRPRPRIWLRNAPAAQRAR